MNEKTKRGSKRILKGVVLSNRMDKTVAVKVVSTVKHSSYNRIIKKSKKHYAHDERNECNIGDTVLISESRPYSKTKKWKVAKILEINK